VQPEVTSAALIRSHGSDRVRVRNWYILHYYGTKCVIAHDR
jgi:hypothetical protein